VSLPGRSLHHANGMDCRKLTRLRSAARDPLRSYATSSGMSAFKPISDNCELQLIFGLFVVGILTSR
jgi:hypothetical protein